MADNLDPETLRDLNARMREMSETLGKLVPGMIAMTAAVKNNAAGNGSMRDSLRDGEKAYNEFLKASKASTEAEKSRIKAYKEFDNVMANFSLAGSQAINGLKQFTNGMLTAEGGMSKYSNALGSMGDAANSVLKNFGPLGKILGIFVKGVTVGAEMVLKYNDNMLKASDALADFGATGAITAKEIMRMGQAAGYSSGELEKWTGITKSLGTDIIGLGGSVTTGVKAFAELTQMNEQVIAGYRSFGVTLEQLNKNQADYIKLQLASGVSIKDRDKADGTLKRTTIEYTNYLMDLSAITGTSVEEAKKAQQAARASLDVQLRLAALDDKEAALRQQADSELDETRKKEILARADSVRGEKERTGALLDYAATFLKGQELAAVQSAVATGNFNELSAGLASGVPEIMEFFTAVKEGKRSPYEFGMVMAEGTKRFRDNLGEAAIQNKDVAAAFAQSSDTIKNETKFRELMRTKSKEEILQMYEEEAEERKRKIKEGTGEAEKDARNAQEQAERRMRLGVDGLVEILQGPVTNAFEKLMKVVGALAKGIAHFAKWLGGPDFTHMFETTEDIAEKQQKNAIELENVNKKIADNQAAIADPEKFKRQAEENQKAAATELQEKQENFRKIRMLEVEEKDAKKRAILEEQRKAASEELQAAQKKKTEADMAARQARSVSSSQLKERSEKELLGLERKRIELTKEENTLEEQQLKKQVELGKMTAAEAQKQRQQSAPKPQVDASGRMTGDSDPRMVAQKMAASYKADPKLMEKLQGAGITDKRAQANILAQIQAESGGKAQSENMNYSPERLLKVFPKYFKDIEDAKKVSAGGQEAIANRVYGGRMGNAADEGFKYRGRGLIQLTGKDNYKKFGELLGIDLVNNPELANDPEIAQRLAVEYFKEKQKRGVDLTKSKEVSKAVGHVDKGGEESQRRELLAMGILQNLPQAADGKVFSGSEQGFAATLHGDELVAPFDPSSPLAKMLLASNQEAQKILTDILPESLTRGIDTRNIPKVEITIPSADAAEQPQLDPFTELDNLTKSLALTQAKTVKLFEETGPTVAGFNPYTGYNAGPMSTDLNLVGQIAEKLGAFDKITKTITDVDTWQKLIQSGIGMNYQMGDATIGSRSLDRDIGSTIGETIKELMSNEKSDLPTALAEVTKIMQEEMKAMGEALYERTRSEMDPAMLEKLDDMISKLSQSNDTQEQILRLSRV